MTNLMLQTTFGSAQSQLMPLILAALLLDFVIVVLWYLIGVIISNSSVKQSAIGELYQFVGTAILVLLVVGVIYIAATVFTQSFTGTGPFSTQSISAACSALQGQSSLLAIGALLSTPFNTCQLVSNPQQSGVTSQVDYPLAASTVITGYTAYATALNLNSVYLVDSYMRFLTKLQPTIGYCGQMYQSKSNPLASPFKIIAPGGLTSVGKSPCTPRVTNINYTFYIQLSSYPYDGYDMLSGSLGTLATLMSTALGIFIAEMMTSSILLYIWPVLLFLGIALRGTPFTRRLGGLLIAIAVVAVLVYPTLFAMEYVSVQNSGADLFNQPSAQSIAMSQGCWPGAGLLGEESLDIGYLATGGPIVSQIYTIFSGGVVEPGGPLNSLFIYTPNSFIPFTCTPPQALGTVLGLFNAYGAIGVTGFFLPILNLIIAFTAIRALSGMLGGDTDLAGLSKLF
jgi:hypothetical protein